MIFGESKSEMALTNEERKKLKPFGKRTGAYICFCTLSDDFGSNDKEYFMELYESGIKIVMLTRFFLEMDDHTLSQFETDHPRGFGSTKADWLMRTTIIRALGAEFAKKHYIWT
jgi:hypothetical protein